jgi:nucleolar protein 16
LGLSLKRPLALRQSGGTEKHDEDLSLFGKMDEDANDESSEEEEEEDDNDDDEDEKAAKEAAAARPPSNTTSRDIPKGFARIERDAQGNVIRVVMSAFDEDDDDDDEQLNESGQGAQQHQEDTPWGVPLNREEDARRAAAPVRPVIAKNAAIRGGHLRLSQKRRVSPCVR